MKEKTVYVNEWQGKNSNDGLSEDAPVLTKKRAYEIRRKEKTQALKIVGTPNFKRQFLSELFLISFQRYSSAVSPPRISVSCSSVNGTVFRFSRGISMKRGLVRAAMARARAMRSLINNAPQSPLFREQIRFVKEKPRRGYDAGLLRSFGDL